MLKAREKLAAALAKEIQGLDATSTPTDLDVFMGCITELHRRPEVVQLAGGGQVDAPTQQALQIVPPSVLALHIFVEKLASLSSKDESFACCLEDCVSQYGKFMKTLRKYENETMRDSIADGVLSSIDTMLEHASSTCAVRAQELIHSGALSALNATAAALTKRLGTISPVAGGSLDSSGKSWREGLADSSSFDQTRELCERTLLKVDGKAIETAIPVLQQADESRAPFVPLVPSGLRKSITLELCESQFPQSKNIAACATDRAFCRCFSCMGIKSSSSAHRRVCVCACK